MLNPKEYTQIVDRNDNVIGKKLRSEITKDDIYRVSSLWVFNQNSELLIAQRPMWKKNDPGKWTESAVGTLEEGETYESNLVKEAKEELGLDLNENKLIFIGKELFESSKDKLFGAIYAVILLDTPILKLNKHEVPNAEWAPNDKIKVELTEVDNRFVDGFDKFYYQVWNKLFK